MRRLAEIIQHYGHDMLIPCDDQALTSVVKHYDELEKLLFVACPPPQITNQVLNKAITLDVARQCGIPVPKTVLVSRSSELHEFVGHIPFPWILKPAEKELHQEEIKSCRIDCVQDISRRFPDQRPFIPAMLLQEYCQGYGVGVEVLLHGGKCLAMFQHRRLKEIPYTGGMAVTAIAEIPDPVLAKSSLTLLRALRWNGIAMVEFKVTPVEGRAILMEVNGRYWGTVSLPILAGIDLPLYQWQLNHGEVPQVPAGYEPGIKWRWCVGHLARLHGMLLGSFHFSASRKALASALADMPSILSSKVKDPELTLSDPMPLAMDFAATMRHILSTDFDILRRRLPWRVGSKRKSVQIVRTFLGD